MLCTCMNPHPPKAHPEELEVLAGALDDTPESVISVHLLAGDPTRPDGIIVQGGSDPGELMSFGSDAAVLWDLLWLHHEATGLLTPNGLELVEAAPVEVRGGPAATPDLWSWSRSAKG